MDKTIEVAVRKYIALRDKVSALKDKHKEELRPYRDGMEKLELALQKRMLAQGIDNMKTGAGTVYLSRVMRATVQDWDALREFILENDAIDMLEHRISKDAVEEFVDANGTVPPGVATDITINTRFRK